MSNMNSHDEPPMSRLFVICNKTNTEDELREAFQKFGTIDDIFLVKDHKSGENKGIAYIKFTKTSDAAQALEELNGTIIGDGNNRAVKILVAASRNSKNPTGRTDNEQEKYVRLFIVINKTETEEDIREEFGQYGTIDNISIVKDRSTGQPKGF
uniref:RRM domain-containing protein n=1 Tax=Megaselia scalaris TaxID=36166 RepID=T1GEV3_MEGSC